MGHDATLLLRSRGWPAIARKCSHVVMSQRATARGPNPPRVSGASAHLHQAPRLDSKVSEQTKFNLWCVWLTEHVSPFHGLSQTHLPAGPVAAPFREHLRSAVDAAVVAAMARVATAHTRRWCSTPMVEKEHGAVLAVHESLNCPLLCLHGHSLTGSERGHGDALCACGTPRALSLSHATRRVCTARKKPLLWARFR